MQNIITPLPLDIIRLIIITIFLITTQQENKELINSNHRNHQP